MSENVKPTSGVSGGVGRQSALQVVQENLRQKQADLDAVQVLLRVIPLDTLSSDDEELLWQYFVRRRS